MTNNPAVLKMVEIRQYTKFDAISSMRSPNNARKGGEIQPISNPCHLVKILQTFGKSINLDPNLVVSEGGHGTSTSQILNNSFHIYYSDKAY